MKTLHDADPLARLFGGPARLKILRLFLFNREAAFSAAEVSGRANLRPAAARAELAALAAIGVLRRRSSAAGARYQANPRFAHAAALEAFVRETSGIRPEQVVQALRRAGNLRLIALSGFFTASIEPQIDLLVVGDAVDERQLAAAVKSLEAELGREIRYASFATADFRYRIGVYDRLLRDVFDYPHRLILDKIGL